MPRVELLPLVVALSLAACTRGGAPLPADRATTRSFTAACSAAEGGEAGAGSLSLLQTGRGRPAAVAPQEEHRSNATRVAPTEGERVARAQKAFDQSDVANLVAGEYELAWVKNDEVEKDLVYAETGSSIPKGLHGIWWMDQWCTNEPAGYVCGGIAVDEFLVTWGATRWLDGAQCTTPLFNWGAPAGQRKGHWTFSSLNATEPESLVWTGAYVPRLLGSFCFFGEDHIDIMLAIRPPYSWLVPFLHLLGFPPAGDDYYWIPPQLLRASMVRTSWGWDRVTEIFPAFVRALDQVAQWQLLNGGLLPKDIVAMIRRSLKGITEFHYPVFQVVDGDGQRTQNYAKYLQWADQDRGADCRGDCFTEALCYPCSINAGRGFSLFGRSVA